MSQPFQVEPKLLVQRKFVAFFGMSFSIARMKFFDRLTKLPP
jgi:hypothetical protein